MKMRPLRVKVRKPISQVEEIEEDIDPMDDVFGLKKVTNDELVLDPTPAVPGRPVSNFWSTVVFLLSFLYISTLDSSRH